MKKLVVLMETIYHSKGNAEKGSIYKWDESLNMFVLRDENGTVISTINQAMVESTEQNMFKLITESDF